MSPFTDTPVSSPARGRWTLVNLWLTTVALLSSIGMVLSSPLLTSIYVVPALSVLISALLVLVLRRYEVEAVGEAGIDGLCDEAEVLGLLGLLDDGFAERSVQYLIDSGLDPEDAAEIVEREFEFTELDVQWLNYHQPSEAGQVEDRSVLAVPQDSQGQINDVVEAAEPRNDQPLVGVGRSRQSGNGEPEDAGH